MHHTIGFIGAGQMARALAGGFVRSELVPPDRIWASDPAAAARREFAALVESAHVVADNREVAEAAEVLVLAVKPQGVAEVLDQLRPHIGPGHLVISICAGVPLASIAARLADGVRLVRVMPNRACLVGKSASGYCRGPTATDHDDRLVSQLLSSVGVALPVSEKLLDAVTGLAGSGPAFVYVMLEALSDGGVLMGLPRDVATTLAVQTVLGAAEMAAQTGKHPAVLKEEVTSPGGTTMAGLEALEERGTRAAWIAAVRRATERCAELRQDASK